MSKEKEKIKIIDKQMGCEYEWTPQAHRPMFQSSDPEDLGKLFGLLWAKSVQYVSQLLNLLYDKIAGGFGYLFGKRFPWVKFGLIVLAGYVLLKKDMQFNVSMNAPVAPLKEEMASGGGNGNSFSQNIALLPGGTSSKLALPGLEEKAVENYIQRFASVAIEEMEKYQIPASIKMGQALLESSAGKSEIAVESNNHFGIKCKNKCKGCTCRNYSDDDLYDMFRVFGTAWESWREHSLLLTHSERYQSLFNHKNDYKSWAYGLKKAGYATDKNYPQKLIGIIEKYQLYKLDQ